MSSGSTQVEPAIRLLRQARRGVTFTSAGITTESGLADFLGFLSTKFTGGGSGSAGEFLSAVMKGVP